jgi:L-asparaginase II
MLVMRGQSIEVVRRRYSTGQPEADRRVLSCGAIMRVEQRRGGVTETVHRVHVAVMDGDGRLVGRAGDPDFVTFWRSAAKPFQAMPLLTDGVVDRFGMTSAELALCCASHSSEPSQVELVKALLDRIGCTEQDLRCGPHTPLSDHVAKDYQARGVKLTPVYSNCSGKHTGMLALARHHGWPTEDYHKLSHPVQQRCLETVSQWTGVVVERIGIGVDGCGVACFALPLRNMAIAYARLGTGEEGRGRSGSIVEAMLRHPELIAGEQRPCTDMMRAHPGRVITKVGAEGVYSALLVERRLGIALKVEDGHGPAAALALAAVLDQLGLRPQPGTLVERPNFNTRGERVGELRVFGALEQ